MADTLSTFALYEMKTVYRPNEPLTHLGYAIVYNPDYAADGSLLTGYVRVDLETLRREYNLNKYNSVAELDLEVQSGLGREVVKAFAERYINGWYHKDTLRDSCATACVDFCRYYYDTPYTLVYIQCLRAEKRMFAYRVFSPTGASEEETIELRRVEQLGMCRYIKGDVIHTLRLRLYDVKDNIIEPNDIYAYEFTDQQFENLLDEVPGVHNVVYATSLLAEREGMLTSDEVQELMDYCAFHATGGNINKT